MSATYWAAKKFGLLFMLLYVGAGAVLIVSYYQSGVSSPDVLASYYPSGRSYPRTTKNRLIREILGFPVDEDEVQSESETMDIISYTDNGAVVRLKGKGQTSLTTNQVVKNLINRDSQEFESYLVPLSPVFNTLLDMHLRFMHGVEAEVGGEESSTIRRLILPKAIISVVYLGLVFVLYFILKRVDDKATDYKGGYSITFGALVLWPVSIIVISLLGSNVVDVIRHMPGSFQFMRSHILGSWGVIFALPVVIVALAAIDVLRSGAKMQINHALSHAVVLGAGLIAVPLVTVGALFAVVVCAMYAGYRTVKKAVVPASWQKKR